MYETMEMTTRTADTAVPTPRRASATSAARRRARWHHIRRDRADPEHHSRRLGTGERREHQRGADALHRPPGDHVRARRHVRAERRRTRGLPGRRDATAARTRPPGVGADRGTSVASASWRCSRIVVGAEQALSVVAHARVNPTSAPSRRCGRCTTASSRCSTCSSPRR